MQCLIWCTHCTTWWSWSPCIVPRRGRDLSLWARAWRAAFPHRGARISLLRFDRKSGANHRVRATLGLARGVRLGTAKSHRVAAQVAGAERMTTTDHTRMITAVTAQPPATLTVQWSDGTRADI